MVTPAAERDAVAHLQTAFGMSERRACRVLGCCRMTMRYQALRTDDVVLRERMKAIAHERRRFGYRRLHVLLRREGHLVNHKRLFRIYREEKLTVRRRGGRKRAMGTRAPMLIPMAPNDRWSLDFVSDQLTDGRRFRVLTVVDDCTRECLALVADTSLSGCVLPGTRDPHRQPRPAQDDRQRQRPRSQRGALFWQAGLDAGVCTRGVIIVNPGGFHRSGRALCHSKHRVHGRFGLGPNRP